MKDKVPRRAGCIDTVREALKVAPTLPEFVHQQHQITHAAPKAIQLPDLQRIALFQGSQKLFERWPIRYRAAHFFFENFFTSCAFERLSLKISSIIAQELEQVLPIAVSSGVNGTTPTREKINDLKTVDYSAMSALYVEAIKEQAERISSLEREFAKLKS